MNKSHTNWNVLGGGSVETAPFCVMGIVNVTPDSFYDGGRHATADAAIAHALSLAEQGARILDVGGESTRPFADEVSASEELARVLPVIRGLVQAQGKRHGTDRTEASPMFPPCISVDTYKAEVAAAALEAGAVIVNDVSACRFDPELKNVLADKKPGYVLMHSLGKPAIMQQNPRYDDVVEDVHRFFEASLNELTKAGLPEDRIVLDPGIGFGKTMAHNLALIANMDRFAGFGRPLLMGLSNKSVWEKLLGAGMQDRETATQAATVVSWNAGCRIHRVHDAKRTLQTLHVASALHDARRSGAK